MKKFESMCDVGINVDVIPEQLVVFSDLSREITITLPPAQMGRAITIKHNIAGKRIVIFGPDHEEI